MPEWGLVAGLPDRCSRGRERIPNLNSILYHDGEKLLKGETRRRKQREIASVREFPYAGVGFGGGIAGPVQPRPRTHSQLHPMIWREAVEG
jgi:hypothetical protein